MWIKTESELALLAIEVKLALAVQRVTEPIQSLRVGIAEIGAGEASVALRINSLAVCDGDGSSSHNDQVPSRVCSHVLATVALARSVQLAEVGDTVVELVVAVISPVYLVVRRAVQTLPGGRMVNDAVVPIAEIILTEHEPIYAFQALVTYAFGIGDVEPSEAPINDGLS